MLLATIGNTISPCVVAHPPPRPAKTRMGNRPVSGHRHRRDPVCAVRPGPQRQGPRHRLVHLPRRADRRGPVGRAEPVTAAIIGPRTMDQLTYLLAGASVMLDHAVLDRIDQIVPPGMTLNPADAGWQSPVLADPAARRRPQAARGVA